VRLNLLSRSWINSRGRCPRSSRFISRSRACCQHPDAVRVARAGQVLDPAAADADEDEHVQPPQQHRVDGETVASERRRGVLAQKRPPLQPVALLGGLLHEYEDAA
jgi:hypothetical protein